MSSCQRPSRQHMKKLSTTVPYLIFRNVRNVGPYDEKDILHSQLECVREGFEDVQL